MKTKVLMKGAGGEDFPSFSECNFIVLTIINIYLHIIRYIYLFTVNQVNLYLSTLIHLEVQVPNDVSD